MRRGRKALRKTPAVGRWGLGFLGALLLLAVAAPVLAPYSPTEQIDPVGGRSRPPGTVLLVVHLKTAEEDRRLLVDRVERVEAGLLIEQRGRTRVLALSSVANLTEDGVSERRIHLLGTDKFGRDLLSRLLFGARISLLIGCLSGSLALSFGLLVGGLAAVGGPWVDGILMRTVDALSSFPRLVLVLALAALYQPSAWLVILVLGATGWMGVSRLVRAEILSLRERDFVIAVRALGRGPLGILLRHLLPNTLTPVLVATALRIGDAILVESTLSFLGLGVQPPTPSWGNMIADGRTDLVSAWWVATFPGAAIALTVITFNLLGDALRDMLDPR